MENVREEEEDGEGVRVVGGWEEGEEVDGQLESTPKRECVQEMSICIYTVLYVRTYISRKSVSWCRCYYIEIT